MSSLERLEHAERMLAEVATVDDARQLIDLAEAARVYARQVRLGTSAVNNATSIKLRAERRVADLVDEGQAAGSIESRGGDRSKVRAPDVARLSDLGIDRRRLDEHRLIRDHYSDDEIRKRIDAATERGDEVSRTELLSKARRRDRQVLDVDARRIIPATANDDRTGDGWAVLAGDFRQRLSEVDNGSVDLIVTDPPYPDEFLDLWEDLAREAALVLVPQGILVALSGQIRLLEVTDRLRRHLKWGWQYAQVMPGASSRILGHQICQMWKPWLAFSNGPWPSGRLDWHRDVLDPGPRQKDRYHWEQAEAPAVMLIDELCPKNGLVLDPMCGTGTYGVAALHTGRRFIGVEADAGRVAMAAKRIAEAMP